jgi:TP901 family phage tail tape measure protein
VSDRTVSYIFRASFNNLTAGLTAAGRSVGALGNRLTATDRQAQQFREGLETVGDTAGKVGLAAAAGIGAIVIATANFDQAMSNVAATGAEAKASIDELRQAAIQAGADTVFSAGEAAAGIENLLKAGVTSADVLGGGLAGALDLAAAGGLEVADASEIAATALTQFKLAGSDIPHVADLLAAGAGKAQGDVSDLAMALKQSGLVASQMGLSVEETTGTLAAFASAGLLGSDAGTSFRTMLLRLANPTAQSAALMKSLGINAYDANGQFVGMASIAGQLQTAFEGKTQAERDSALATIFGSDAIRAAAVLYSQGSKGVSDWTANVNDAGYAADVAGTRLDNLKGDFEAFKGSLETALIGSGEGSTGMFRGLVQGATDAVNAYSKLPPNLHSTTTALLGITAVLGGGVWFSAKAISAVASMRTAITQMGASAATATKLMKGLGVAVGALVVLEVAGAAMTAFEKATDRALPSTEALTRAILHLNDAQTSQQLAQDLGDLGAAIDRVDAGGLQGVADGVYNLGESGGLLGGAVKGLQGVSEFLNTGSSQWAGGAKDLRESAASIDAVDQALAGLVTSGGPDRARQAFADLAISQGLSADQQKALLTQLPGYTAALDGASNATTLAGEASDGLTASTSAAAAATKAETAALKKNVDAMRAKRDAALSAFDAETQWRVALKEAEKAAKHNTAGIKGDSKAAIDNRNKISALAAAWNNQSDALQNTKGKFHEAKKALYDVAIGMGVGKDAAHALVKELLDIPSKTVARVTADTAQARAAIFGVSAALSALHDKDIHVRIHTDSGMGPQSGQATGGYITGPGTGTSDSIPSRLSNGEFVVKATATANNLPLLRSINAEGDRRKFASGGYVSRSERMYASRGSSWGSSPGELRGRAVIDLVSPWGTQQVEVLMSNVARREIDADAGFNKMRAAG